MKSRSDDEAVLREFDRDVLRAAFVDLFWTVIEKRKQEGDFKFADLARACGRDKTAVSHWFSDDDPPNWTENTISDIARGLDVQLIIKAKDRKDGAIITPYGVEPEQTPASAGTASGRPFDFEFGFDDPITLTRD